MEEEQLPGYIDSKHRSSSDILCDCGVSVCCGFTVISFLFLNAWSALRSPIPPEQMNQAMIPFIVSTCIALIIWLIYKAYSKLTNANIFSGTN